MTAFDGHAGVERAFERLDVAAARGVGRHRAQRRPHLREYDHAGARSGVHRAAPATVVAAPRGDAFGDPAAELRVRLAEVLDRSRDDVLARHLREAPGDVVDQPLLRVLRLQAVEVAGLLEVVHLARHLR